MGSIPRSGRSPEEGNGSPPQYSCLENSVDGGACWATVHGVAKSWTRLTSLSLSDVPRLIVTVASWCAYRFLRRQVNWCGITISWRRVCCDPHKVQCNTFDKIPANVGEAGSIPGSGRSLGVGNGNTIQYFCLESSMDRGAWWVTVHGVAELDTTEWLNTSILWWHLQAVTFNFCLFSLNSFYFSFRLAITRNSNTMLNKSGESEHPWLVPDLGWKCFQLFTTENDMSCGLVIYGFYYVELCSLYIHFVESDISFLKKLSGNCNPLHPVTKYAPSALHFSVKSFL